MNLANSYYREGLKTHAIVMKIRELHSLIVLPVDGFSRSHNDPGEVVESTTVEGAAAATDDENHQLVTINLNSPEEQQQLKQVPPRRKQQSLPE